MRVSAKENHPWYNVVFEKVLVGYASLDKSHAVLLDELSNQDMEISYLLVGSGKTMINHKMDPLWIPDPLNAHLAEDLDR